ncbi:MAG: MFS transporter [Myxococcales bacterium]|nr:MFS transporter [Myxococcales bacterium]
MMKRGNVGLLVLFVVYTLNYLDRSLVYILFEPIRQELELTDLGLALLGSTSFVLFYTTLGVPFGRLSDRVSRTKLIAAGLAVWSLASAGTGLAGGFLALLACRVLVGVGEATLGPAAYSLLADWFPPSRRGTASALFAAGIPVGAGIAMIAGGWMGQHFGWRATFPMLSLPGLVIALAVLMLPEPERGAREKPVAASSPWSLLLRNKALLLTIVGYAAVAVASNAAGMWIPKLLSARYERGIGEVGLWVGICAVAGGLLGTALGGWLSDRLERRMLGGRLVFGATVGVLGAGAWALLLVAPSLPVALFGCFAILALGLAWLGAASADVQDAVPAMHRATAISVYTLVVNVIGLGIGAPAVGALSDALGLQSALWLCPVASLAGAAVLAVAAVVRMGSVGTVDEVEPITAK